MVVFLPRRIPEKEGKGKVWAGDVEIPHVAVFCVAVVVKAVSRLNRTTASLISLSASLAWHGAAQRLHFGVQVAIVAGTDNS